MGRGEFAQQPALDGVRAVAVASVLAFHLGAPFMAGGYLGVSVFFTLSGFLITSLLLSEHANHGRIDIRAFYVRRARRLLPASLLCISGVALLASAGLVLERVTMRSELHSALFQYANWKALLSGGSYRALFDSPSPVAHFWSLAIEEQFYFVWPIVIAGLATWAARRGRYRPLVLALVALYVVLAISAPLTARWWNPDAAYFASWARFAEIAAGAALAVIVQRVPVSPRLRVLAPVCLFTILVLCAVTPNGRGWAYSGGLPLFALVSVGLIAGLQVESPVRRALSWWPIVLVGQISYGLYLFHWPLFLVLDESRTGLDGPALAAVRLAATFTLALASFWLLERPIRTRRLATRTPLYLASAAAGFAVVIGLTATAVPTLQRAPASDAPVVIATAPVASSATTEAPRTVVVFGDSIADWLLRDAAATFARHDIVLVDAAHEACDGAVDAPRARDRRGNELVPPDGCKEWTASYPQAVAAAGHVDDAVLVLGQAPMVDRLVGDAWVDPCQDMQWYTADLARRVQFLDRRADHVVLALPAWGGHGATWVLPDDHLERMACVRTELQRLAGVRKLPTVDLATLLCPQGPGGECSTLRERDGTHVDPEDATLVLTWLLDQVEVEPRLQQRR